MNIQEKIEFLAKKLNKRVPDIVNMIGAFKGLIGNDGAISMIAEKFNIELPDSEKGTPEVKKEIVNTNLNIKKEPKKEVKPMVDDGVDWDSIPDEIPDYSQSTFEKTPFLDNEPNITYTIELLNKKARNWTNKEGKEFLFYDAKLIERTPELPNPKVLIGEKCTFSLSPFAKIFWKMFTNAGTNVPTKFKKTRRGSGTNTYYEFERI